MARKTQARKSMVRNSVAWHFDSAVDQYDEGAWVHAEVAQRVFALGEPYPDEARVLELGCGSGLLTQHLAAAKCGLRIDAVDISAEMLRAASQKLSSSTIAWMHADARALDPCSLGPYDCIASSASFQWMQPLEELFEKLFLLLVPGGRLVFSCMASGTFEELHSLRRELFPHNAVKQNMPEHSALRTNLVQRGFLVEEALEETHEIVYADARSFLCSIKAQGFTGGMLSKGQRPLHRGEIEALINEYDTRYQSSSGQVKATYCVSYFLCSKKVDAS